jgi:hypothetical protein
MYFICIQAIHRSYFLKILMTCINKVMLGLLFCNKIPWRNQIPELPLEGLCASRCCCVAAGAAALLAGWQLSVSTITVGNQTILNTT